MRASRCFKNLTIFSLFLVFKESFSQIKNTSTNVDINADAKAIVDSKLDPVVVAKILPYRTQDQCSKINTAVASLTAGVPLIDPKHVPLQNTKPYDDLLFALISDPMTIFSMYLGHYLDTKDETYIIMIFIQIDDRMKFKETFDSQHCLCFDDARRAQRHPFANALKVWAEQNRIDISIYKDRDDSCDQGTWLTNEQPKWEKKSRTGLEGMLMKHTIPYAQRGIGCYGNDHAPRPNIIDDIKSVKNQDLIDLYTSLVNYIQNDSDYLVRRLHDHCDEHDTFTMWIVVLSTRRTPEAMKALDDAFMAAYDGTALIDYVLNCNCQDKVFLNMLAAMLDSSYTINLSPTSQPSTPQPDHDD